MLIQEGKTTCAKLHVKHCPRSPDKLNLMEAQEHRYEVHLMATLQTGKGGLEKLSH